MSSNSNNTHIVSMFYLTPVCWTSATTNNKLNIHTGDARAYVTREEGLFEFRSGKHTQTFNTLIGAFLAYYKSEVDSSLWDITEGRVFIESKRVVMVSGH